MPFRPSQLSLVNWDFEANVSPSPHPAQPDKEATPDSPQVKLLWGRGCGAGEGGAGVVVGGSKDTTAP